MNLKYYELENMINDTIEELQDLKSDLEVSIECEEKGLSIADTKEVKKAIALLNEAEKLKKMCDKLDE